MMKVTAKELKMSATIIPFVLRNKARKEEPIPTLLIDPSIQATLMPFANHDYAINLSVDFTQTIDTAPSEYVAPDHDAS